MLSASSSDPLWRAIGDTHTHGGKASRQAAFSSSAPTDLPPFRIFEHGMGGSGFDIWHMPNPRTPTSCHRKDQLYVSGIDLLVPGNTNGPAQASCASRLPERR